MEDRWMDRLSEYLDDELPVAERAGLEAHLGLCADCRGVLEELRRVVGAAATLEDEVPARDLWPGIEARLGPVATQGGAKVISLVERRRHLAFTLPQLAAASVALMAASAGIVWLLVARGEAPAARMASDTARTAVPAPVVATVPGASTGAASQEPARLATASGEAPDAAAAGHEATERTGSRVRLVRSTRPLTPEARANRDYNQAVADLEAVLRQQRSRLQPETVKALEGSLADIDKAIADARRALARDPASVYLNAHLAESKRLKLELLQQVATITQS